MFSAARTIRRFFPSCFYSSVHFIQRNKHATDWDFWDGAIVSFPSLLIRFNDPYAIFCCEREKVTVVFILWNGLNKFYFYLIIAIRWRAMEQFRSNKEEKNEKKLNVFYLFYGWTKKRQRAKIDQIFHSVMLLFLVT